MDRVALPVALSFVAAISCLPTGLSAQVKVPPVDPEALKQAKRDLKRYYEDRQDPNYRGAIAALGSANAATRRKAGLYLHALLDQSMKDKLAGKMPERGDFEERRRGPRTGYEQLRSTIGYYLARQPLHGSGENALAPALWLFRAGKDYIYELDERGMAVLKNIRAPAADAVIREVLSGPHSRYKVVELALRALPGRDMADQHEDVRRLCGHYHEKVRRIARFVAWKLDLGEVPDYDPTKAFTKGLEKTLKEFLVIAAPMVPEGKALKHLELSPRNKDDGDKPIGCDGWLLETKGKEHHIRDLSGSEFTWPVDKTKIEACSFEEFAARYKKLGEEFNKTEDSSKRDEIRRQAGIVRFSSSSLDRWEASVPEILVAAWALEQGKRQVAADLLFPPLSNAEDEVEFFDEHRDRLAAHFDKVMLEAFCQERDYDKALRWAKHLSKDVFKTWRHQDRAIGLMKQLPRRRDVDFKTLTLPTPEEWKALQRKLDRKGQVEYLTKRIRLMHCQQLSIPGGIDYTQEQYREPYHWGMKEKPAEVINPFTRLLGMNLNGKDLLVMVPYLLSENYTLGYDLYRFLPQGPRTLHPVRWVVANIICETAQEGIVDFGLLGSDDEEAKKKHVAKVREWCIKNESTTTADRLMARITDAGTDWEEVKRTFWNLYNLDQVRACAAIHKMGQQREKRTSQVIQLLCLLGRKEYVGHAREWAKSESEADRFHAALLLFQHGDRSKNEGLDVLLENVRAGHTMRIHAALKLLMARKDPKIDEALLALLGKDAPKAFMVTLPFLQRMVLAGHQVAYQKVEVLLSGEANFRCYTNLRWQREPLKDANEVAMYMRYGWQPEASQADVPWNAPKEDLERNRKQVRAWFEEQWKLIQAGKKSEIREAELSVDWGDWLTRSTGWIRRF